MSKTKKELVKEDRKIMRKKGLMALDSNKPIGCMIQLTTCEDCNIYPCRVVKKLRK